MAGIDFNPVFKVEVYEAGFFPSNVSSFTHLLLSNKMGLCGMEIKCSRLDSTSDRSTN